MPISTGCLYSRVRNISGKRLFFGFLPPHGRTLGADEEIEVFGDIYGALIRFERSEGTRHIVAFERALQAGLLEVRNTVPVIVSDDANPEGGPKMVRLHNGTLGTTTPCWETSTSDSEAPIGDVH